MVGEWLAGSGVAAILAANDGGLTLITEARLTGRGVIDDDEVKVSEWGVEGLLSKERSQIIWSNGFVWKR